MDKKQLLKYLATFGAGAITGKIASDLISSQPDRALQYFIEVFGIAGVRLDSAQVLDACSALTNPSEKDESVRQGAAAFLSIICTPPFRYLITAPTVRATLERTLLGSADDKNELVRKMMRYTLGKLKDQIPNKDESNLAELNLKLQILQAYVKATPAQRASHYQFSGEITSYELEGFLFACREEIRKSGRSDKEWENFLVWFNKRPKNEHLLLPCLCIIADSPGDARWQPDFFSFVEVLRNEK